MPEPGKRRIRFTLNGEPRAVEAHPMGRVLDLLRDELRLTGTKEGCGEGECGACAVLLDGELVNSCLLPALHLDGCDLRTIEGIGGDERLHAVQEAFLACGGAQCGICTPGIIMAAWQLLQKKPRPSLDEIKEGLSGNLCRCTGYTQICEAVAEAAKRGDAK